MASAARVINLSDYRKPVPEIASRLHIEISSDNDVTFDPIKISQDHALAMLKMLVATCAHLIEVQGGRA